MSDCPNAWQSICQESEEVAALLRGKSAEDLRSALHHMARSWRFSPADLQDALRHAAQCRHWRKAQVAWDCWEALHERAKATRLSGAPQLGEWMDLVDRQDRAYAIYKKHMDAADKLWRWAAPTVKPDPEDAP